MEREQTNATEAVLGSLGPVSLAALKRDDVTTAYWSENENFSVPLQDDWVEVKVKAIYFDRDLAKAGANQGIVQFSGVVRHVGPSVKQLQTLDRVFGAVVGAPANLLRAPATSLAKFGEQMTFAEAATVPFSCITGMYAVERVQEQSRGTTTLVFGADTPKGLAAAQWASRYSHELIAIVEESSIGITHDALNLAEHKVYSVHDIKLEEKLARYSSGSGGPHRVVLSFGGIESLVQAARFVNYGGVLIDLGGAGLHCYTQIAPLLMRKNASFETFSPKASIEAGSSNISR
jgi:NADPH:quinone reductase-like Zn-dependent oxidoreductase